MNETLDAIKESQTGTHCLTVYPDLLSFRAIYASFTKILLENNNEILLVLPYYETPDMVKLVLSGANSNTGNVNRNLGQFSGIDVEKYEKEGSLIIRDSLKANVDSYEEQQEEDYEQHTIDTRKSMDLMEFLDMHQGGERIASQYCSIWVYSIVAFLTTKLGDLRNLRQ